MPAEDGCRFRLHASPKTSPYLCVISAHQRWAGHELGRWPACSAADQALIEPLHEAIAQTGTAETFWRVLRLAQQNTPERCRLAEGQKNDAGASHETRLMQLWGEAALESIKAPAGPGIPYREI